MEELIKRCCNVTGLDKAAVEQSVYSFLDLVTSELSEGRSVNLGRDFGAFIPKLRESHLPENSPRTPKDSRYKVFFREGPEMRKRLKVTETE